jgi:hypothetical protein
LFDTSFGDAAGLLLVVAATAALTAGATGIGRSHTVDDDDDDDDDGNNNNERHIAS